MKSDRLKLQRSAVIAIKKLDAWEHGRIFTGRELCEIAGITRNTVNALHAKGIIISVDDSPFEGIDYYRWSGMDVE